MTAEPEPDDDKPARADSFDIDNSHSSAIGPNPLVINNNYYSEPVRELLGNWADVFMDRLLTIQTENTGLLHDNQELDRLRIHHESEIERLQQQLAKVQGIVPALLELFVSLGEDRERTSARRAEVERAMAGDQQLGVQLDQLQRYLDDLDAQQDRVRTMVRNARVEAGVLLQLWAALRMRWFTLAGPEPETHDVSTMVFALPGSGDDKGDLLEHARRVLDEAHKILVEVHRVLEEVAAELYQTGFAQKSTPATPDAAKVERELVKVRSLLRDYEKNAAEQKKRHAREIARRQREAAPSATPVRKGTNGLLPGISLFLLGVLFRQLRQMPVLAGGLELVVGAAMLILAVLPVYSLWKWSKDVDSRTRTTAAMVGSYCLIMGNLGWVVALAPGLAALFAVVSAKRVSAVFVLVVLVAAGLGIVLPDVMWWSWTGFDWIARVV